MAGTIGNLDVSPDGNYIMRPSGYRNIRTLAASTAETETIPTFTDANGNTKRPTKVLISKTSGSDIYVAYTPAGASTVVATIPSSDTTDGTAEEINPGFRYIAAFDKISVISPDACKVNFSYFF